MLLLVLAVDAEKPDDEKQACSIPTEAPTDVASGAVLETVADVSLRNVNRPVVITNAFDTKLAVVLVVWGCRDDADGTSPCCCCRLSPLG